MWQLKTLGGLSVVADDDRVPSGAATQRRRLAILAVLASSGPAGVSREKLLGLFWPDLSEERARAALTQALYALRRDLGVEELVQGTATLQLNESVLLTDVGEFRKAVGQGRFHDAAGCYAGPFLDGVTLSTAPEFERWADTERRALVREALSVMERVAREATAAGDPASAVRWWQAYVGADPLAATGAVGLMEALAAAGDRAAAVRHAQVYERLVADQLELPPDASVVELAARLRSGRVVPGARVQAPVAAADHALPSSSSLQVAPAQRPRKAWPAAGALLILAVAGIIAWFRRDPADHAPATVVLAIGEFHAAGADSNAAGSLTDMLANSLAQVPGLKVISSARMIELTARPQGATKASLAGAARLAGATDLIEGSLYGDGGSVRLDVRRTTLSSGEVAQAISVTAPDLLSAVDSGAARLALGLGAGVPTRAAADVTTESLLAHQLYLEGLRAHFDGHQVAAVRLFERALDEDSTFAMAAYYLALAGGVPRSEMLDRLSRAVRLSAHAGDRERQLILWQWADEQDDPARVALADSLVARYAAEPFAHFNRGSALAAEGRFDEAIVSYRTAIALDARAPVDSIVPGRCVACEARGQIVAILRDLDSLPAAEREARAALRIEGSPGSMLSLRTVLLAQGRFDEVITLLARETELTPDRDAGLDLAILGLRKGDYAATNAELERRLGTGPRARRADAAWWLQFSYRAQGRLEEARRLAREIRDADSTWGQRGAAPYKATMMAAVLYEEGRYREAAALWDSIASLRAPRETSSRLARHRAWFLTLAATALAAAGDTAGLPARADTIEALGRRSAYGRDHRLHHHVRGLVYAARGKHEEAIESYRRAMLTPTVGYTRTQYEMARSLQQLGRLDAAIGALRPVLHGPPDGANSYLIWTDVHEFMATLFDAAGQADSAALHAQRAAAAWRGADPAFSARRARMTEMGKVQRTAGG